MFNKILRYTVATLMFGVLLGSAIVQIDRIAQGAFMPTASLSANPTLGSIPLNVIFGVNVGPDSSRECAPASYSLNFGDGQSTQGSSSGSVSHTYTSVGDFLAVLTFTREVNVGSAAPDCQQEQASDQVRITVLGLRPMDVSFERFYLNDDYEPPYEFKFDASSSTTDPNCIFTSSSWNFDDGNVGNGIETEHTFADIGLYKVTLTMTDSCGRVGNASDYVLLFELPPCCQFPPSDPTVETAGEDLVAGWNQDEFEHEFNFTASPACSLLNPFGPMPTECQTIFIEWLVNGISAGTMQIQNSQYNFDIRFSFPGSGELSIGTCLAAGNSSCNPPCPEESDGSDCDPIPRFGLYALQQTTEILTASGDFNGDGQVDSIDFLRALAEELDEDQHSVVVNGEIVLGSNIGLLSGITHFALLFRALESMPTSLDQVVLELLASSPQVETGDDVPEEKVIFQYGDIQVETCDAVAGQGNTIESLACVLALGWTLTHNSAD